MSASQPPTPDDLVARFGVTPSDAQAIADAMTPLQSLTSAGGDVGAFLEASPASGPQLAGIVLQNISTQVQLVSQSAEVLARALAFYAEAQGGAVEALFPPPDQLAQQLQDQYRPLFDLLGDSP